MRRGLINHIFNTHTLSVIIIPLDQQQQTPLAEGDGGNLAKIDDHPAGAIGLGLDDNLTGTDAFLCTSVMHVL